MNDSLSKFLELYPDAQVVDSPVYSDDLFNLLIEGHWICIEKKVLDERERFMFSLLSKEDTDITLVNKWWNFLTGKLRKVPKIDTQVKIIQFKIEKTQSKEQSNQWLNVFKNTIDNVVDAFLVGKNTGILIQSRNKMNVEISNIRQMVELLDSDFYTNTKMYVGEPWEVNENLSDTFNQERHLFYSSMHLKNNVNNLSTVILDFLIGNDLKNTPVFESLHKRIDIDASTSNMINVLYDCDSNITKASKLLYLHRNTLEYRIDKFFDVTGFNLKNHDDLILCFLLLK
ncbi:helix-turn-helix domain-containing protein [Companilactobacillus zhachilii]|uniref:helix-turn-helix domain-containing protein n=1 Tax=Companilactobacillus zhachilii TaxID=2304606 RepID=UPI004033C9B4